MPIECRFHHAFPACQATSVTGTSCTIWPRRETTKCAEPRVAARCRTRTDPMNRPSVSWITIPLIVARVRFETVLLGECLMRTRSDEPQAAEAPDNATT